MSEWFGEFFSGLAAAGRALYEFGDPTGGGQGWIGGAIMLLWLGPLGVLPLYLAKLTYGKHEWVSATMGIMGASSLLWWLHGVIPHVWIQFTESARDVLAGVIFPESVGFNLGAETRIEIADMYMVATEGTLQALMIGGIVVTIWAALRMQRSLPKTLAAGETKPESGGYK